MSEQNKLRKKRTGIAAVAIAAIATVSLVIVFTLPQPPQPVPSYAKKVMLSEVQVSGTPSEQFVELYTWEAPGSSLAGWKLYHGGKVITLPAISNLGALSYVVLRFGPGTSDTDAADMNATVYFDLGMQFIDLFGELKLVDDLGRVVDYYNYGNVVPGNPVDWPATDAGILPSPLPYKSMQVWGVDQDNSSNWFVDNSTTGIANAYNFNVTTPEWGGNITVELSNGINIAPPATAGGDYRFADEAVVTGTPVSWITKEDITEMADFTLKHYAKLGFMKPFLGADGKLNIAVSNSSKDFSTGSCNRFGQIKVNVGQKGGMAGKVGTKYTVEHEIMHAIQAHEESGYDHWGEPADDPFQEGVATWGGISSTMKNYNLTWNQTMAYMKEVGKMNWFDNYRDTNTSLWPWPASGWDRYMGMGLFVKYLNETHGNGTIGKIMMGIKTNYNGTGSTGAQAAIENELGISFAEAWRRFQVWLADGSATKANQFPKLTPHSSPSAPPSTSTPTSDGPVTVAPWGSDIEFINCAGKTARFLLSFGHLDASSQWRITIIYTKPDGTKVTTWFTIAGSSAPVPVNPTLWANITIVKTRIGSTGNGSISIAMNPIIDQRDGRSRGGPYCSNGTGAQTTENSTNTLIPDMAGVFTGIWLDTSKSLTIHVKNATSNDPMDNKVGFSVLRTNDTVLYTTPPDASNPKMFGFTPPEPQYYIVNVFWISLFGPIPPEPTEIRVDVSFTLIW